MTWDMPSESTSTPSSEPSSASSTPLSGAGQRTKTTPPESFRLNLTGRMSVLVELADYGPIQIRVEDESTVVDVLRVLVGGDRGQMSVDSYGKRVQRRLQQVLDGAT